MGRRRTSTAALAVLTALSLTLLVGCTPWDGLQPDGPPPTGGEAGQSTGPLPEPEPVDAPVEVFVAPRGQCDPDASGRSADAAVCDLEGAHRVVERLHEQGRARGDLTIRFAGGRYDMGTYYWRTWAQPGHTLRFVPDWWEPGTEEPAGPLPEFHGEPTSSHWLSVVRDASSPQPVGTVQIAHLAVTGYRNGIMVNGGLILGGSPEERAEAIDPPVPYVSVHRVVIEDLGNRHVPDAAPAEWALALRNVVSGSVRDSRFEWIANAEDDEKYAHAVYAMESEGVSITGNLFHRISGDPVRLRNDNRDFLVLRNHFVRSGTRAAVSDWHVDREAAKERDQGWEVSSEEPEMRGNRVYDGGYRGGRVVEWRPSEEVR
ncbi:hypothetical protein DT076_12340 [Desertihabitans brevis]|uniref:Right-handed parallel beta-helix repeat-containing protein n=1 Tax=Desertihabitans brevis TaxID=2268447 RepID=A0A367YTI5_9ACTN|nr:hypothetical protein [Desertihabitans brevis]RCK69128.1 hypothetical protein DT076_12340 [Desertihabitans brevis]